MWETFINFTNDLDKMRGDSVVKADPTKGIFLMLVGIEDNHAPKDELLRVEWNLGKRCNYNCSYCGNELHNKTSEHMFVYTATIDKIVEAPMGKKIKIRFTGGEPFVHP